MKDWLTLYAERAEKKHHEKKTKEQKANEQAIKRNEENLSKSWEEFLNK